MISRTLVVAVTVGALGCGSKTWVPVTPSEISRTAKSPDHVRIETDDGGHVEVTSAVAVGCEWPQSPCSVVGRLVDESSGELGPLYERAGRDVRVAIAPSARRLAIFAAREAPSKAPVFIGIALAVAAGAALLVYLIGHIGITM